MIPEDRIRALPLWSGPVTVEPLTGGITNRNYLARDSRRKVVIRLGQDLPHHGILRWHELAASRAAHAAGVSPAVLHVEPGLLALAYVEARTLTARDLQHRPTLDAALALIAKAHRDIPKHLRGPSLVFWPFHVIRDYAATLRDDASPHAPRLADLLDASDLLEQATGPTTLVFGHNDLLPANFLDDGTRLWLIDWDYAGWNTPLFDLGGLSANNALSPRDETHALETYFGQPPDAAQRKSLAAQKAAAALRETLWSMVSESRSTIAFDYAAYTAANLQTFHAAMAAFKATS